MSTLVLDAPGTRSWMDWAGSGAGEDAETIRVRVAETFQHLVDSSSGGATVVAGAEQLAALAEEAAADDWDRNGGLAMDPLSVAQSLRFLLLMPLDLPAPHVGVDPDGAVAFDWQTELGSGFSISFAPDQLLTFAGVFPLARLRGAEYFADEIPSAILEGIRRAVAGR
jgi:hypothetical protein